MSTFCSESVIKVHYLYIYQCFFFQVPHFQLIFVTIVAMDIGTRQIEGFKLSRAEYQTLETENSKFLFPILKCNTNIQHPLHVFSI